MMGFSQSKDTLDIAKKLSNILFHDYGNINVGLLPICGIDPDSGTELGLSALGLFKKDSLHSPIFITPTFYYSTKHWLNANVEVQRINSEFQFLVKGEYSINPQKLYTEKRYTSTVAVEKFFEQVQFRLSLHKNIKIDAGQQLAFYIPERRNDIVDTSFNVGSIFGISFDSRDKIASTTQGILIQFIAQPSINIIGQELFYKTSADARWFYAFSTKLSIGVQTCWQYSSDETPYLMKSRLSGPFAMRGFDSRNRYMNTHSQYVQAELRRKLAGKIGLVANVAVGNSATQFHRLLQYPVFSYGAGGRLYSSLDENFVLRLDLARTSTGEYAIYMGIMESF